MGRAHAHTLHVAWKHDVETLAQSCFLHFRVFVISVVCTCFICTQRAPGDLPPELGKLTKLEELLVNSNAFSGESLNPLLNQ